MKLSSENIAKNFVSLVVSQYGGMVCNLGFSIWLTRLLSPKDFGVIAIALFYFNFFNWITEWGWESAFMAHKEIELHRAASTHLLLRFVLGAIPLMTFIFGRLLLRRFVVVGSYNIILLLAGVYWFEKMGLTYKTILEREYQLKRVAILEFFIIVGSYMCAIYAALQGLGVYSLVLQRFIEKGVVTVGYFLMSPWKMGFDFDFKVVKIFFKNFGIGSWVGGIFGLAIYDFMPFLIGFLSDTHQAGLYAKAFSIATFPVMLTGIFSRMTIPLYTLYQFNSTEIKHVFIRAQAIKLIILVPAQLFLGIFAHYWIPFLLGSKWRVMIPIYRVMTIYGLFRSFFDDVPNVITYGYKNIWALTKNLVLQSVFIILVGPILVWRGKAFGGAIAISGMMVFATILFWKVVFDKLNCGLTDFYEFFVEMPSWIKDKFYAYIGQKNKSEKKVNEKSIKKILLVGEFSLDASVYTYSSSFYRVLKKNGYEVVPFNCKKSYLPGSKKMLYDLPWYLVKINNVLCNRSLRRLAVEVDPDLIFVIKGDNVSPRNLGYIKENTGALMANFYPDNPFVFWNGNSNSYVLNSLPLYDHFMTWGEMLVLNLQAAGCKSVSYFPFAYDEDLFPEDIYTTKTDEDKYSCDISFVGTWDAERERILEQLCMEMPDLDLAIWGNLWEEKLSKRSPLRKRLRGSAIYGENMIKIFRLSTIVLNFVRQQNITSHNMRTMEVLASRGFMVTNYTDEQAKLLFKEDVDLVCFNTVDDLVKKIEHYLKNRLEREKITNQGYKSVQKYKLDFILPKVIEKISLGIRNV